ncbi:putative transposase [Thermoflavimicrobium dichotomicum]|uniref:Putative transposase n=2 Tax=Thermoflavimicrobium dichotomicum TaxID=46223 RepID=A0A1I3S7N6_9BACL|nr:putative transposase [Thermoflavimicrobium dichotomicum]
MTDSTYTDGVGVDLGLKYFVMTSKGHPFKNINKSSAVERVEKPLKRAQRALSRKLKSRKKRGEKSAAGGGSNMAKNVLRVQKLRARLKRMRDAYHAWVVSMLVKARPAYITIEKLHVKGMM